MGFLKGKITRLNTFSKARSGKQACVNERSWVLKEDGGVNGA